MNRVSVVIPCYNRSGLVNETVRNALAQSLPPHEVIVIDDGSTDDSVASLRSEFGGKIRLIQQANQGPGAARNAGLKMVSGDFVWLMDSDDLASLNKLESQVAALQSQNADVVYSPWVRVSFDGQTVRPNGPALQQSAVPPQRNALTWFMTDWSLVFQHCLFRTSILQKAGFYRTDMWTCDDSEYFTRILCQDAKTIFNDQSITLYRSDDHGKVTGSGFLNTRRISDWGSCLLAMAENCDDRNDILQHPSFQYRLWKSMTELKAHCPNETGLISQHQVLLCSSDLRNRIRSWTSRFSKTIRTWRTGTRWPTSFQPAPLTQNQSELIQQLGYQVMVK